MNGRTLVIAAAVAAIGCSAAWAYEGGPVKDGGSIAGEVKYQGTPPAAKPIEVTKDKGVCGVKAKVDESLLVGKDGGVENAVVFLRGIDKGKPMPTGTPVLDQKDCRYQPHVLLIPAGATVDIRTDDAVLHNIHTYSKLNFPINMAQPKYKKVLHHSFHKPEIFEVRCDAHGWMDGWFVVEANPYYAVTDASGTYELTDVPPGRYELVVWQEKLGEKTRQVTVSAKSAVRADFTLAGK